jgi:fructokinase
MNKKPIVAGIGELLWDMLPSGKQLGGAPCNFAFHAMQTGCESHVISAIGQDELGEELIQTFKSLGLSDRYIQKNEFPTSKVTILLNEQGQPDYTIHEQVAWDHIQWNQEMGQLAEKLDAICFGSLAQREPESRNAIVSLLNSVKSDCLKVFDINLRQHYFSKELVLQSIVLSDVLKLNDDELPVVADFAGITGDLHSQLDQIISRYDLKYIVYTMGSKGSVVASPSEYSKVEAPVVQVADTVGAGDAFTAVFISGILNGYPLALVHQKATEIAALVCSRKGATPEIPNFLF